MTRLSLIVLLSVLIPSSSFSEIIWQNGFESYEAGTKNIDRPNFNLKIHGDNYNKIVNSHSRSGNKSLLFYNKYIDTTSGYRCEVMPLDNTENLLFQKPGTERIYAFSIFIPEDYICDGCNNDLYAEELHFQLFGRPDVDKNETWLRNPCISLIMSKDYWRINVHADSNLITIMNETYTRSKSYILTDNKWTDDKGKWTDFVFHVKASYSNDGWFKVYKNGELIVFDQGANCYNDSYGIYPTYGTYKFSWRRGATETPDRTIYIDDIKIADSDSKITDFIKLSESSEYALKPPVLKIIHSPVF